MTKKMERSLLCARCEPPCLCDSCKVYVPFTVNEKGRDECVCLECLGEEERENPHILDQDAKRRLQALDYRLDKWIREKYPGWQMDYRKPEKKSSVRKSLHSLYRVASSRVGACYETMCVFWQLKGLAFLFVPRTFTRTQRWGLFCALCAFQ